MLKKIIFSFFVVASFNLVSAQQNILLDWAKKIDEVGSYNEILHPTIDKYDNVYLIGSYLDTVDVDLGSNQLLLTNKYGAFFSKNDDSGNLLWVKSLEATGSAYKVKLNEIQVDNDGDVYIIGDYGGTMDFDPSSQLSVHKINGVRGSFIAKYDQNGNYLWSNVISSNGHAFAFDLEFDTQGNVYFSGYNEWNAILDSVNNVQDTYGGPFLIKYDKNGNYLMSINDGLKNGPDWFSSFKISKDGDIYITGAFKGICDFDFGINTVQKSANYDNDIFYAKYSKNGELKWVKSLSGNDIESGNYLDLDSNENLYITGKYGASIDFDPGSSTVSLTSYGGFNCFLAKYDSLGNYVWAKGMGSAYDDHGYHVRIANNNVYLAGMYNEQPFLGKYDFNGTKLMIKYFGGSPNSLGTSINVSSSGSIYFSGTFIGNVDFDPSPQAYNLTTISGFFIAKYTECSLPSSPSNTTASSNLNICPGTTTLTASGIGQISWYSATTGYGYFMGSGNSFTTPSINSFKSFYAQDSNTCGVSARTKIDVSVVSVPLVFIYLPDTLCVNDEVLQLSNPSTGYFSGTGVSGNTFSPSIAGVGNHEINYTYNGGTACNVTNKYPLVVPNCSVSSLNEPPLIFGISLGATSKTTVAKSVKFDSDNNTYVVGEFSGTINFNPLGTPTYLSSSGNNSLNDIFVAKYDNVGILLWAKQIGESNYSEIACGIEVDKLNDVYVVGQFYSTIDTDPSNAIFNLAALGSADVFITKLNLNGDFIWAQNYGAASQTLSPVRIKINDANELYLTGKYTGAFDADPSTNTSTLNGSGTFLLKYDAAGNYVWSKNTLNGGSGTLIDIAFDSQNNCYGIGTFSLSVDFDPSSAVNNITSKGGTDIFLLKYDNIGNHIWTKALGSSANEIGNSIVFDKNDNFYITGGYRLSLDVDFSAGSKMVYSNYYGQFLAKYSSSADCIWADGINNCTGSSSTEINLAISPNEIIYFSGLFASRFVDFQLGFGTKYLTSTYLNGNGTFDIYLTGYNTNGELLWSESIGNTGDDRSQGLSVDNLGNVVLFGSFQNSVDLDLTASTNNYTTQGSKDAFIAKYGNSILTNTAEPKYNSKIFVYPNPTEGQLHIDNIGPSSISVYNILGEKITSIRCDNNILDLSYLDAGIYLLYSEENNTYASFVLRK